MDNELLQDTIEQYVLGRMTAEQVEIFERQVEEDPDLAHQVVVHKAALLGMQALVQQDLQQKFAEWDVELELDAPKAASRRWIWVSGITLVVLLGAVFFYGRASRPAQEIPSAMPAPARPDSLSVRREEIMPPPVARTPKKTAQKNTSPVALSDGRIMALQAAPLSDYLSKRQTLSTDSRMALVLQRADEAMVVRDFAEAERLLKGIPIDGPLQNDVLNRLPFALFYQEKFSDALPVFGQLARADRFEKDRAEWYQLLCYLPEASQNRLLIKGSLEHILSSPKHFFRRDAKKIKTALQQAKML